MSVCLGYQAVYRDRRSSLLPVQCQILALVMLFSSLCFKVWLKLEAVELGYEISEVRKETVQLDQERQELELQYSVLTRPDVLAAQATDKLDLAMPQVGRVKVVVEE